MYLLKYIHPNQFHSKREPHVSTYSYHGQSNDVKVPTGGSRQEKNQIVILFHFILFNSLLMPTSCVLFFNSGVGGSPWGFHSNYQIWTEGTWKCPRMWRAQRAWSKSPEICQGPERDKTAWNPQYWCKMTQFQSGGRQGPGYVCVTTTTGRPATPRTTDWGFGVKNEECVSLDSSVIFEWSGGFHKVAKVANKDDFDNYANGDVKNSSGPYTWKAPTSEGKHYFICEIPRHCHPMKVAIEVSNACSQSLHGKLR